MSDDRAPAPSAAVDFAGASAERLHAEIDALRQRLDSAERALAEERRAFAVWRRRPAEVQPMELSPQALNDLAEMLLRLPRRENRLRRILRFMRPK